MWRVVFSVSVATGSIIQRGGGAVCLSSPHPTPDRISCVVSAFPLVANGNDSKKFKGDIRSPGVPSRVVHLRKLPNDINETEVIGLGLPFGKVTNLLMLKGKNQVGAVPPQGA